MPSLEVRKGGREEVGARPDGGRSGESIPGGKQSEGGREGRGKPSSAIGETSTVGDEFARAGEARWWRTHHAR